jgi:hypothetical protein
MVVVAGIEVDDLVFFLKFVSHTESLNGLCGMMGATIAEPIWTLS